MITDVACPYAGCGLSAELEDERRMASSDPDGWCWVRFYRCPAGHHWPEVVAP